MNKDARIFVAGHRGLVGSALCRVLRAHGFTNLVLVPRSEVDLADPVAVKWFFSAYLPEYVFLAAARVGGIMANTMNSVEFMLENLRIQGNVISNAKEYKVKKLLFLGSSCAYPKHALTPVKEEDLMTGPLEPSNECYALAKIAGIRLCQAYRRQYGCDFISTMPTNLYGIGDHYDLETSHVIPGMIRKFHEAKLAGRDVELWGNGDPVREFLYADDLAEACLVLMQGYSADIHANITSGAPYHLWCLAELISLTVGFEGAIKWNPDRPNGTPVRILDGSILRQLGWRPKIEIQEGLKLAYQDFLCRQHS